MYQFRLDDRHMHRSMFHSLRVQLLWVSCFSLVLPLSLFALLRTARVFALPSTEHTLFVSAGAAVLTLLALRRITGFHGAVLLAWILPILVTSFGGLAGALFIFRLPYSTILLTLCFGFSLLSFYILAGLMTRGRRATCYLVPIGRALDCDFEWTVRTITMDAPQLPADRDAVIVADLHADLGAEWERLLTEAALAGHPVYHITQLSEAMTGKVQFDHLSENSFGAMIPVLPYGKIKRGIDFVAAVLLLPLLLPLMLAIGVAIRLDSSGPALFRQLRAGHRGQSFGMFKFRTMTVIENGEDQAVSVTNDNDARITRVGRFLRTTRLDELPQVFNVLRGQMSWIGPRPEAVGLSNHYAQEIPNYRYRHLVRPGISGWAQVHQGHVTSVEEVNDKLRYDFYYVKNFSFWIDMVIALRTLRVIATGFGAK